jgi:hypothetical protein
MTDAIQGLKDVLNYNGGPFVVRSIENKYIGNPFMPSEPLVEANLKHVVEAYSAQKKILSSAAFSGFRELSIRTFLWNENTGSLILSERNLDILEQHAGIKVELDYSKRPAHSAPVSASTTSEPPGTSLS